MKSKILVLGDSFLDEYITGTCTRISQEAPVPILEVSKAPTKCVLGGAANTAANIASLGGNPSLLTLLGEDEAGEKVRELAKSQGIGVFWASDGRMTTRKARVMCQGQQLLRMDYEVREGLTAPMEQLMLNKLKEDVGDAKLVVLSDYAKGFFGTEFLKRIVKVCAVVGKPVIIDPKPGHDEGYVGASYVTPNLKELMEMTGNRFKDYRQAASVFSLEHRCAVLLTRGAEGISLTRGGDWIGDWPAQAQEVFDVSGAGDTVVAAFSLALAEGATEEEAIIFANKAAGVVVGKHGTATVTREEIK